MINYKIISLTTTTQFIKVELPKFIEQQSFNAESFNDTLDQKLQQLLNKDQLKASCIRSILGPLFFDSLLFTFNVKIHQHYPKNMSLLAKNVAALHRQKDTFINSKELQIKEFDQTLKEISKQTIAVYKKLEAAIYQDLQYKIVSQEIINKLEPYLTNVFNEADQQCACMLYTLMLQHYASFCLDHNIHVGTLFTNFEQLSDKFLKLKSLVNSSSP